jgi:hypothetical protein
MDSVESDDEDPQSPADGDIEEGGSLIAWYRQTDPNLKAVWKKGKKNDTNLSRWHCGRHAGCGGCHIR